MAETTKQIGKPELTTLVNVYTGKMEELALAYDAAWRPSDLRKDGFPYKTHLPWGYVITRDGLRTRGTYAVFDLQKEVRASILRDRIKGLWAQIEETRAELETLYIGDNNAGQGGS